MSKPYQTVIGELQRLEKMMKIFFPEPKSRPNSPENEEISLIRPPSEFRNSLEVFLTKKSKLLQQTHLCEIIGWEQATLSFLCQNKLLSIIFELSAVNR